MSQTLAVVRELIRAGKFEASRHGYRELAKDGLSLGPLIATIEAACVVEDYPDHVRGPCVLVLQSNEEGDPVHALWGLRRGESEPAVLITAYRPDPRKWDSTFTRRTP